MKYLLLFFQGVFNVSEFFSNLFTIIGNSISKLTNPQTTPILIGGLRPVTVDLPSTYNAAVATALVIGLHGFTDDNLFLDSNFRLKNWAHSNNMIYIAPNGIFNSVGWRFWKATDACCDIVGAGPDDGAYIISLLDEASKVVNIDKNRVFIVGHSNGGFMGERIACDYASRIAGVISLGGAGHKDKTKCKPSGPVNILSIRATSDETVFYLGGAILGY